jgi:hypothetical protein
VTHSLIESVEHIENIFNINTWTGVYRIVLTCIGLRTILQVVAAVGFKGRRLEIPEDMNPLVAALIESCWAKYVLLFHLYTPFHFYFEFNRNDLGLLY